MSVEEIKSLVKQERESEEELDRAKAEAANIILGRFIFQSNLDVY